MGGQGSGRRPDRYHTIAGEVNDLQGQVLLKIREIAGLTDEPRIISALEQIRHHVQQTNDCMSALRELRNVELQVRTALGYPVGDMEAY